MRVSLVFTLYFSAPHRNICWAEKKYSRISIELSLRHKGPRTINIDQPDRHPVCPDHWAPHSLSTTPASCCLDLLSEPSPVLSTHTVTEWLSGGGEWRVQFTFGVQQLPGQVNFNIYMYVYYSLLYNYYIKIFLCFVCIHWMLSHQVQPRPTNNVQNALNFPFYLKGKCYHCTLKLTFVHRLKYCLKIKW